MSAPIAAAADETLIASAAPNATSPCSNSNNQWLELFLRMYALHCKESDMEMNSRALQAAVSMQDALETDKRQLSSHSPSTPAVAYVLTAVPLVVSEAHALLSALAYLPLARLDFSECYLGDAGTRVLADALSTSSRCNGTLRALHLRGVGVSDATPLAYLVTAAQHLHILDLSCNKLGTRPQGVSVLCGALQHHPALREVHLGDNMISGGCGVSLRAIAEWVVCAGHGGALQRIDLRFNAFGFSRDIAAPATAVRASSCIYGSHPLVDALLFNNTLEFLELKGNALPVDIIDAIEAKLAVNRRTKEIIRRMYVPRG
ncbi:leucine rich repeat containing 45 [Trypanosoma grayi]|uniref:TPA: leucine rich repeat containing 45 n=1 Tax=Trypanosoma grayi TaxID=71804 RepID=UPI0004F40725|nr:leucine rich repeat containing 45 [Trypanosoma grayi]KEG12946.1 leucine rich repeat containing 45 [Trypanosoma grayi]